MKLQIIDNQNLRKKLKFYVKICKRSIAQKVPE